MIARVHRGDNGKARALVKAAASLPGKSSPAAGAASTAMPVGNKKAQKRLSLNNEDDDDDDDEDDDDDDDDDEYKALLRRSSHALSRKGGYPAVGTKPADRIDVPAAVSAQLECVSATRGNVKLGGFQDSCNPAKETGEVVAMKTGTYLPTFIW